MPGGDHAGPTGDGPRNGKCCGNGKRNLQGAAATENCVCTACNYTILHQRGEPCSQTKCPQCGALMTRERQED